MRLLSLVFGALGLLSMLYGLAVLGTASGTSFWMVWEGAGVLALILAALFFSRLWIRIPALFRYAFWALVLAGALWILICCGLMVSRFGDRGREDPDCLIVLGSQVRTDGPSLTLRYRLDTAAAYLEDHPDIPCILSGGQGPNEPCTEAEGMRDYLTSRGIDESRLILEERSSNTIENILFSKALLPEGAGSIAIITNDFHLFRGTRLAAAQGLPNVTGIAAPSVSFYLPNNMLRECMGIAKDCLLGHMTLF